MFWLKTHARLRHQLSAYIDGQLSDKERKNLEAHLGACPACQRELAELKATVATLQALPLEAAPRSFALSPEQVARQPRPAPVSGLALPMRLAGAALAATLAVLLVVDLADVGGNGEIAAPAAIPVDQAMEAPPAPAAEGLEADARREEAPAAERVPEEALPVPAPQPFAADREEPSADLFEEPAAALPGAVEAGGGIDPLRAVEIALGAGLGALFLLAVALVIRNRRLA